MAIHEIPVIDISPFLDENATISARERVVDETRHACQVYGFFQLIGHGIPQELQNQMIESSRKFFDLPLEEKKKCGREHAMGTSGRGYEVIGGQQLQADALPDLKEGIYFGEEIAKDDSRAGKFLQGPNLWPDSLSEKDFRQPILEYREKLLEVANRLLEILALGLPYAPDIFKDFTFQPVANVRLLHYPPQTSTDARQLGAGAHTDFGCLTLLLQQPSQTGLEVLYPPTNTWIPVPAIPGRYVVNVGDLLDGWTRGAYRSAVHRVINKGTEHRYSVPFFYNGNLSYKLRPLDGTSDDTAITVEQHIIHKTEQSYGVKIINV